MKQVKYYSIKTKVPVNLTVPLPVPEASRVPPVAATLSAWFVVWAVDPVYCSVPLVPWPIRLIAPPAPMELLLPVLPKLATLSVPWSTETPPVKLLLVPVTDQVPVPLLIKLTPVPSLA